jgi:hypothetical protein
MPDRILRREKPNRLSRRPAALSGKSRPPPGRGYRPRPGTSHNIEVLARARNMPKVIIAMADVSPPLKETELRLCPHCLSVDVVALGRVTADSTGVRSGYRCRRCSTDFLRLSDTRRIGTPDRRAAD